MFLMLFCKMFKILQIVFQFVIQPFFPISRRNATARDGKIVSIIFLSHVLAGIVVFFGVVTRENTILQGLVISKNAWMSSILILGFLAVSSLLISSCLQRREFGLAESEQDPSINLQLVFLWGFGLATMLLVGVNITIFLQCLINDNSNTTDQSLFLLVINVLYALFIVFQFVLLTINKQTILKATVYFHFSIVSILAVNFALWYSSTIYTFVAIETNITMFLNISCFQSSEIKMKLGNKLYPILFPPQMEFYILASTLTLSLWWNSKRYVGSDTTDRSRLVEVPRHTELNDHASTDVNIKHILSVILGVVLNVPIAISTILMNFVYKWQNRYVRIFFDISETLSSVCSCILACACCYKIRSVSLTIPKPMLIRDYILILSSSGVMAFLTAKIIEIPIEFTLTKMTTVSCICGMFETFFQTHLLISSNIKTIPEFRAGSLFISSCAIILLISNLTNWFLESYNKHLYVKARYFGHKDLDVVQFLFLPFVTFYRFFSGMSAYSMYKRFKPR